MNAGGGSNLLDLKSELEIIILGPYKPRSAKRRLRSLRDFLRSKGYIRASLVEDLSFRNLQPDEDEDTYYKEKSEYGILRTDISIFVFFCESPVEGPTVELAFICNNPQAKHCIKRCTVFFERRCYKTFSTQLKGTVKFNKMYFGGFSNDDELYELVLATCTWHLIAIGRQIF